MFSSLTDKQVRSCNVLDLSYTLTLGFKNTVRFFHERVFSYVRKASVPIADRKMYGHASVQLMSCRRNTHKSDEWQHFKENDRVRISGPSDGHQTTVKNGHMETLVIANSTKLPFAPFLSLLFLVPS